MSEPLPRRIVTDRLLLRPFAWSDYGGYLETMRDDACRRYVLDGARIDPARAWLRTVAIRWFAPLRGDRYWAMSPTAAVGFVGYVALHRLRGRECWMSYAVHPAHRRRGYATEAIRAVCNAIASCLPSVQIGVRVRPDNDASIRLAERLRFERVGEAAGRLLFLARS